MVNSNKTPPCQQCTQLQLQFPLQLSSPPPELNQRFCPACLPTIHEARTNKTYTVPATGHKYAYIHYPPFPSPSSSTPTPSTTSNKARPTLLFLHGFPSTSYEWRHQILHFLRLGYGILAPDLLGSGGTHKPRDVRRYVGRVMAADVVALLDHEGVDGLEGRGVVGIAHDWGTYLLSQLVVWWGGDGRFVKYVFFSVPHTLPGRKTDLVAFNKAMKEKHGYELYGYQYFLSESSRAGKILGANWETFFNLIYPHSPALWETHMAPPGAMEAYLLTHTASTSAQFRAPWITDEDRRRHHEAFGDDYTACLKWYERGTGSWGVEEEREALARAGDGKGKGEAGRGIVNQGRIMRETLMLAGLRDAVCSAERARGVMGRVVEKGLLKVVDIDAGHWIMQERREETNAILADFFKNGVHSPSPSLNPDPNGRQGTRTNTGTDSKL